MKKRFDLSIRRLFLFSSVLVLTACGGGSGGSDETRASGALGQNQASNVITADTPFVFVERDTDSSVNQVEQKLSVGMENGDSSLLDMFSPYDFKPGAKLVLRSSLDAKGVNTDILVDYFGSADYDVKDLTVSEDGKTILFAAHGPANHPTDNSWNIYEYSFETGEIRRIIRDDVMANLGQDTAPAYSGDLIVFSTDRAAGNPNNIGDEQTSLVADDANCYKVGPNERPSLLHSMTPRGENIVQLTYGSHHDTKTTPMKDGRVSFLRWSRSYELLPSCTENVVAQQKISFSGVFGSQSYPSGIEQPQPWAPSSMCDYAIETPLGYAIATNHYTLLRISADGSDLQQLYQTVSTDSSDESMLVLEEIVQSESGRLMVLIEHTYNQFLGGNIVELMQPGAEGSGVVFSNLSPSPVIDNDVSLYPNQLSKSGWFSAMAPYRDGTNRVLISWSQCNVIENGVASFCDGQGSAEAVSNPYGIWVYDPRTDSRLPVVQASPGVQYSELAISQPNQGVEYPFVAYNPNFEADVDDSRVICDDPSYITPTPNPTAQPTAAPTLPPVATPTPEPNGPVTPVSPVPVTPVPPVSPVPASPVPATPVPVSPVPVSPIPATPAPTPVGVTPTPIGVTPTPVGVTPTPVGVTPTPVGVTPTPVGVTPTPVGVTPTPVGVTPTPVGVTPTPVGVTPTPDGATPTPEPATPTPTSEPLPEPSSEPEPTQAPATPTPTPPPSATPAPTATPTPEPEGNNTAPVADAGDDQPLLDDYRHLKRLVVLDGSRSSDADGDALTYRWTVVSPESEAGTEGFSDATAVQPEFTPRVKKTYTIQLVVNDGTVDSAPDFVHLTLGNTLPVADAGEGRLISLGERVELDGSGSSDVNGDPLTFSWRIIDAPEGSNVELIGADQVHPSFTADVHGSYTVSLVVNDGFGDSEPDTVTFDTQNTAPIADAGPDQPVRVATDVQLDGSGSRDPDGDAITFSWSFLSKPEGSVAELSDPDLVDPTFNVDLAGTYVVQLIVSDGTDVSEPDTVVITRNARPIAEAGDKKTIFLGESVTLDGTGSSDPDGDALNFSWSVINQPDGSNVEVVNETASVTELVPTTIGLHLVQLIVDDGALSSEPDTVEVLVLAQADCDTSGETSRRFNTIIRDFEQSHPDFEFRNGTDRGIVQVELGSDDKPVYAHGNQGTLTTNNAFNFNQWYNDVPGVNIAIPVAFTMTREPNSNVWTFSDSSFFPIDGLGWGDTPDQNHNFHFTLETHLVFDYEGGEEFTFSGDDDLFLFINGKLVIDIGGVHSAQTQTVRLDEVAEELGIEIGSQYSFDLFFAERHTIESNFSFQTNIRLECDKPSDGVVPDEKPIEYEDEHKAEEPETEEPAPTPTPEPEGDNQHHENDEEYYDDGHQCRYDGKKKKNKKYKKNRYDNRSGLGDDTNPGKGSMKNQSGNTGTENPNQSGSSLYEWFISWFNKW